MSPKISIVEDDPSVVRALSRLCRSAGYEVSAYGSAEAFLEESPGDDDCLLLDVQLPGLSGLELQARLRADGCTTPVVVMTAFDREETRREALDGGARAFLPKPVATDTLLAVLRETMEGPGAN